MKSFVRLTGLYDSALLGFFYSFMRGIFMEVRLILGIVLSSKILVKSSSKYPAIALVVFLSNNGHMPLGPPDSEVIIATASIISSIVNFTISILFSIGGRSSSEYRYSSVISLSGSGASNTL